MTLVRVSVQQYKYTFAFGDTVISRSWRSNQKPASDDKSYIMLLYECILSQMKYQNVLIFYSMILIIVPYGAVIP